MNKIPCEMIQDLFPSYIDELTSEKTNGLIKEHLEECPECKKVLARMTGDAEKEKLLGEDDKKEIQFLKKENRLRKRIILGSAASILLCILAFFIKTYIVGTTCEEASDVQNYMVEKLDVEDGVLHIRADAGFDSYDVWNTRADAGFDSYVISRMKFKEEDGIVTAVASEVPVSFFNQSGKEFTYKLQDPENLRQVKLGGVVVWEDGSRISYRTGKLYRTRHDYVGDASANGRTLCVMRYCGMLEGFGVMGSQLETSEEPYGWILQMDESITSENEELLTRRMEYVAYVLIGLTGNLDHVTFEYQVKGESRSATFDEKDATEFLGQDIKNCGKSAEVLNELLRKAGM